MNLQFRNLLELHLKIQDADNGNKVLSILWPPSATVSQFLTNGHASFQPENSILANSS